MRAGLSPAYGRGMDLSALFSPRQVAVIGATEKPGSVGRAVVENLRGFQGAVHLVNRKHPEVLGRRTLARIADLPAGTDLAVVVTPVPAVPEILRECAAAVIISAGFKETGRLERRWSGRCWASRGRRACAWWGRTAWA